MPDDAPLTRPYFERASIAEPRYTLRDAVAVRPARGEPALTAAARYTVAGVPVEIARPSGAASRTCRTATSCAS